MIEPGIKRTKFHNLPIYVFNIFRMMSQIKYVGSLVHLPRSNELKPRDDAGDPSVTKIEAI